MSKLIRETVQYYGEELGDGNKSSRGNVTPFYCGMSFMLIPSFVIRICSPTFVIMVL